MGWLLHLVGVSDKTPGHTLLQNTGTFFPQLALNWDPPVSLCCYAPTWTPRLPDIQEPGEHDRRHPRFPVTCALFAEVTSICGA